MIKYIIITIFFAFVIQVNAQEYNVYNETLSRFTTLLDTGYNWQADKIFLEEVKGITNKFPAYSGRYMIVVLNNMERDSILSKGQNIYMYRFLPMTLKNGEFIIEISGFSCKEHGVTITNAGYRYSYKYNCQDNKIIFNKYQGGGI